MAASVAAIPDYSPRAQLKNPDMWLVSPRYDLFLITFSAALVLFPHVSHTLFPSIIFVDLLVTMLIGGHTCSPHTQ